MTATDSCGEVVIKYNVIKVDGNCISKLYFNKSMDSNWDESGNTISHAQKITVNDTTAPTTTVFTPSINVEL
jgi:hypothetical protein